jgi:hypothetical protein
MKNLKFSKPFRYNGGQGILEGVCGTLIFVSVFVGLVVLAINFYTVLTVDTTLRLVAMETAKLREEFTFFLGQKRNDIDEGTARSNAAAFASALAQANGLDVQPSDVQFNDVINADQAGTRCSIKLRALRLPYGGGAFPLFIQRDVSAVVARMNVPAPALVDINAASEGGTITLRMPSYGAYRPLQTATTADGRFALDRPDLFQATNIPGVPLPGPIKSRHYYGLTVGNARVTAPIAGNGRNFVVPNLLPGVGQQNISL